MDNIPDPRLPGEPPARQFEINDLLSRALRRLQVPPPTVTPFPITPEEFAQLWARAHAMVTFGLSALLELQMAADAPPADPPQTREDPAVAGTLLWSAYDYLNEGQLPIRPELHLDPSEFRRELDEVVREYWRAHPRRRPRAKEIAVLFCPVRPQRYDTDPDRQAEAARVELDRRLARYLGLAWREYIATVPPP
jgi:hypothetical protein